MDHIRIEGRLNVVIPEAAGQEARVQEAGEAVQ